MKKQSIETSLGRMWGSWLEAEYNLGRIDCLADLEYKDRLLWFNRLDVDHNPEMFLTDFEETLKPSQIEFINHLIQVMVEFDNHVYL